MHRTLTLPLKDEGSWNNMATSGLHALLEAVALVDDKP